MNKKFAIIGVAGYIAPRHLRAIKDTNNILIAALDKNDSVGILDSYFPSADFFTEFERFDRHIDKLRRNNNKLDYVSICSPNYLHDAHVRFALRSGANVICEKPLVINPWNLEGLSEIEKETGRKVNIIMQLRLHPSIVELKKKVSKMGKDKIFNIDLTYITPRGHWYSTSWKGDPEKSGGIIYNIGIHFFDILLWIFGKEKSNIVHLYEDKRAAGFLELDRANIRWFLSLEMDDLELVTKQRIFKSYRSIKIDGEEIEFSKNFTELHTKSYQNILEGKGFGITDVRSSIEVASNIHFSNPVGLRGEYHPLIKLKDRFGNI